MSVPKRLFLYLGFAISVVSVVINTFVVSAIGSETADVKGALSRAQDAAVELSTELTLAEQKFDTYKVLHNVAKTLTGGAGEAAQEDAQVMLEEFLAKYYVTATGIPSIEFFESQTVDEAEFLEQLLKAKDLLAAMNAETDPARKAELGAQVQKLDLERRPKTELGKKLLEVGKVAEIEVTSKTELDWALGLLPTLKEFRQQTLASIKARKAEVAKHEGKLRDLARKGDLATYLAVALQMFGMLLVLAEAVIAEKAAR